MTNSVAQFVRVVITILKDLFLYIAMLFLDNIGVKGPYTEYDNEESLPGIRRFVYKYIQNLDKTIDRIERARACIRPKSQFCQNRMNIIRFICGYNKRSPTSSKVIKVLEWKLCTSVTEVKAFIRLCMYYWI